MSASATDKFKKLANNFSTTLSSSIGSTDTTIPLTSVTNLATDTGIVLVIDRVNSAGTTTPASREYVKGTISSNNLINVVRGIGGSSGLAHSSGAVVEQVVDQVTINDAWDGVLTEHNQDGTHVNTKVGMLAGTQTFTGNKTFTGTVTLPAATVGSVNLTTNLQQGWETHYGNTTFPAPNTVTYNGNRSYTCVFNGTDLTSTLSNGMRLKFTRTVTAPTQCTSLNGTTQFYSKSSPAGMTFTNNFVVSAWVKLTSYGTTSTIASRYNGTSGWTFTIESDGGLQLCGFNASSANFSKVKSVQAIPLNKWIHVAAQLDMATFTASTTTSYTMMDGVDVPAVVSRGGTNPTALVQAGNLEIGSQNAGNLPFPGKIAQVAIYSAKVTEANIAATYSQGLAGTETSLISAYSFNNSINDLNANANNLTANGSAVATNADSPFTQDDTGTPSGTTDFGIITSKVFSTNTTLTVQVPEGCTIPTSGGVSAVSYSTQKAPYGFPTAQRRYVIQSLFRVQITTNSNATYGAFNGGGDKITVPVGEWLVGYDMPTFNTATTGVFFNLSSTDLTGLANTANIDWSTAVGGNGTNNSYVKGVIRIPQSLAVATPYILYTVGATTLAGIDSDNQLHQFVAECALL